MRVIAMGISIYHFRLDPTTPKPTHKKHNTVKGDTPGHAGNSNIQNG